MRIMKLVKRYFLSVLVKREIQGKKTFRNIFKN